MATPGGQKGGFDCEFVKKPPVIQSECPVCLQVLREPHQAPCCGNSFCLFCVAKLRTNNKPCPTCNEQKFATFHDKRLQRSLYEFNVFCSHKLEGCDWKGELGQLDNHLNLSPQPDKQLEGCKYSEIKCIYCSELIKRCDITIHQDDHCPERPFSCEYCHSYVSQYEDVIHNHWLVCGSHPVHCPNECGKLPQRQALENHIARDCPKTLVYCDFRHVGCDVRLPCTDLQAHLNENLFTHMSLQLRAASYEKTSITESLTVLQNKVERLESENKGLKHQLEVSDEENSRKVEKLERENNRLQESVASLHCKVTELESAVAKTQSEAQIDVPPPEFTLDLSELQKDGQEFVVSSFDYTSSDIWFSPPFFSYHQGYKMCFGIRCEAIIGDSYYDRVSGAKVYGRTMDYQLYLCLHIMKGEFDDRLKWPFKGFVTIELVNTQQVGACTCMKKSNLRFGTTNDSDSCFRVMLGDMNGGLEAQKFHTYHGYFDLQLFCRCQNPNECENSKLHFRVVQVLLA